MASHPVVPDSPTTTAALSLLELRQHLLRRAGTLSARARGMKKRGSSVTAARLSGQSERLLSVARTMADNNTLDD